MGPEGLSVELQSNYQCSKYRILDAVFYSLSVVVFIGSAITVTFAALEYLILVHKSWAFCTIALAFVPSCFIQLLSLRWNQFAGEIKTHWTVYVFHLAIIHRFWMLLASTAKAIHMENSQQRNWFQRFENDSFILNLFTSFLIMVPQIVFQIYISTIHQKMFLGGGAVIVMSVISIIWALAVYSLFIHKSERSLISFTWLSMMVHGFWRGGMLASRIATLVMTAICFKKWIFFIFVLHTIGMTLWIAEQKTMCCDSPLDEYAYKSMVGALYFFDFFRLMENQIRLHTFLYYSIIAFENVGLYSIFVLFYQQIFEMNIFVITTVAVLGGTFIGLINMTIYFNIFKKSKKNTDLKHICSGPSLDTIENNRNTESEELSNNLVKDVTADCKSLISNIVQHSETAADEGGIVNTSFVENDEQSSSVVVVEDPKLNVHKNVNHEVKPEHVLEKQDEKLDNQLTLKKRRAICSLTQLGIEPIVSEDQYGGKSFPDVDTKSASDISLNIDPKSVESSFIDSLPIKNLLDRLPEEKGPEDKEIETLSQMTSVHDYENLCPLGVARPPWCIRSWQGYTDIENYVHDDSVVRDRRRDTLTSTVTGITMSSDFSDVTYAPLNARKQLTLRRSRQDDYLDTLVYDLADWESSNQTPSEVTDVALGTIYEERESDHLGSKNPSVCSVSSLVATIDEIRKCTSDNSPCHIYHRGESQCEDLQEQKLYKKRLPLATATKMSFPTAADLWAKNNDKLNIIREMTNYCLKDGNGKTPLINAILSDSPILQGSKTTDTQSCCDHQVEMLEDVYVDMKSLSGNTVGKNSLLSKIEEENILNTTTENEKLSETGLKKNIFKENFEIDQSKCPQAKSALVLSLSDMSLVHDFTKTIDDKRGGFSTLNCNESNEFDSSDKVRKHQLNRPRRKFSLLRERFEPKLDQIVCVVTPQSRKLMSNRPQLNSLNKKISVIFNDPDTLNSTVTYEKENTSNSLLSQHRSNLDLKEKRSLFLKQVLSPPKFQSWSKRRIFSPNSKFAPKSN